MKKIIIEAVTTKDVLVGVDGHPVPIASAIMRMMPKNVRYVVSCDLPFREAHMSDDGEFLSHHFDCDSPEKVFEKVKLLLSQLEVPPSP